MVKQSSTYQRIGSRALPTMLGSIGVGVLIIAVAWFFYSVSRSQVYRQSFVIVGHPTHVVSWDADKRSVTIMDIPTDVVIKATSGYGRYAVGSLFTLDHLDHKNGGLFTQSMSDAFGIPIRWYIVPGRSADVTGSITMLRNIFSWSSIWPQLLHQTDGSMPLATWLSYVGATQSLSADAVHTVNVSNAFVRLDRPDGTTAQEVDENRLDYVMGTSFLDSGLRSESRSVAIYNTTDIPTAGQRAARVMGRLGLQLVFVGNAAPEKDECQILGTSTALASKTAYFIRDYFQCVNKATANSDNAAAADIVVLLGRTYASQFISANK